MILQIDNNEFELVTASDVIRDGEGVELWDKKANKRIIEFFRNDARKQIELYTEKVEIHLELLEKTIEFFDIKVGRTFQD